MTIQNRRSAAPSMPTGLSRMRPMAPRKLPSLDGAVGVWFVIVLQLNWLLSGVIVVEVFFAYRGFGKLLYDAATFGDIYLIEACTLVAVFVAVFSQFISDVGYTLLNPRIRFS